MNKLTKAEKERADRFFGKSLVGEELTKAQEKRFYEKFCKVVVKGVRNWEFYNDDVRQHLADELAREYKKGYLAGENMMMRYYEGQKEEIIEKLEKRKETLRRLLKRHQLDIDEHRLDELDQAIETIKKI